MSWRTQWTFERDTRLARMIRAGFTHATIARAMGTSTPAVSHRASRLGLSKPPKIPRIYTQGETQ